MRTVVVIATLFAGCTPHAEPELVASFDGSGGPFPAAALEGDRLYVFHTDLNVVDLATGEVWNLGRAIGGGGNYTEAVVTEGWGYWISDDVVNDRVGRLADGRDRETVTFPSRPEHLVGHRGCAYFTRPPALYGWCPEDPEPVELTADGPVGDVAVDDDAFYFFSSAGLTRMDRASGERTVLDGRVTLFGAELVMDEDQDRLVWWIAGRVFSRQRGGSGSVELGTLPDTGYPGIADDLTVDEHGFYRGAGRLRRDSRVGETFIPRGWGHAAGGGHAAWFESESWNYRVYTVATDGDPVAPLGGDDESLRPPFL